MGLNNFFFAFCSAYPIFCYTVQGGEAGSFFVLLLFYFVVPIALSSWLWHSQNFKQWGGISLVLVPYIVSLFLTGFWPFYCFGYIGSCVLLLAAAISLSRSFFTLLRRKKSEQDQNKKGVPWVALSAVLLLCGLLTGEVFFAFRGFSPGEKTVELEFPLKQGTYYIVHGGNDPSINGHFSVIAQRGALDIVKLNALGFRAGKLIPQEAKDFNIFGEKVYSPLSGVVLRAVGTQNDSMVSQVDSFQPAGNHLAIRHSQTGKIVLLAHLLKGSLQVKEGDLVKTGQFLARVGNSGNTSEPHLHIHCVEENEGGDFLFEAEPVSMLFNNTFLVRNSVYSSDE